jgi:hypothetical protein
MLATQPTPVISHTRGSWTEACLSLSSTLQSIAGLSCPSLVSPDIAQALSAHPGAPACIRFGTSQSESVHVWTKLSLQRACCPPPRPPPPCAHAQRCTSCVRGACLARLALVLAGVPGCLTSPSAPWHPAKCATCSCWHACRHRSAGEASTLHQYVF